MTRALGPTNSNMSRASSAENGSAPSNSSLSIERPCFCMAYLLIKPLGKKNRWNIGPLAFLIPIEMRSSDPPSLAKPLVSVSRAITDFKST